MSPIFGLSFTPHPPNRGRTEFGQTRTIINLKSRYGRRDSNRRLILFIRPTAQLSWPCNVEGGEGECNCRESSLDSLGPRSGPVGPRSSCGGRAVAAALDRAGPTDRLCRRLGSSLRMG